MQRSGGEQQSIDEELADSLELSRLLEALYKFYGYDFREYALASLRRRVDTFLRREKLSSISSLQEKVLRDRECMARLLETISVGVSSMFRDPDFFLQLRQKVIPHVRTLPLIRIWHAGCATGEEVYSLAILLHEEGLLNKSVIYATDLSERLLYQAKAGIFPMATMRENTRNYQKSGGKESFSDYYTAKYDTVIIPDFLRKKIVWAQHNMVSDASFNEFHLILFRNVMIYFNEKLQAHVLNLMDESLAKEGYLGLGHAESIRFSPCESSYEVISRSEKIYKKRNEME